MPARSIASCNGAYIEQVSWYSVSLAYVKSGSRNGTSNSSNCCAVNSGEFNFNCLPSASRQKLVPGKIFFTSALFLPSYTPNSLSRLISLHRPIFRPSAMPMKDGSILFFLSSNVRSNSPTSFCLRICGRRTL